MNDERHVAAISRQVSTRACQTRTHLCRVGFQLGGVFPQQPKNRGRYADHVEHNRRNCCASHRNRRRYHV